MQGQITMNQRPKKYAATRETTVFRLLWQSSSLMNVMLQMREDDVVLVENKETCF